MTRRWLGYGVFAIAVLALSGCAALMPQRTERTLPAEIISELSDSGCKIQVFGYGRSPKQGERVTVRCATQPEDARPEDSSHHTLRLNE